MSINFSWHNCLRSSNPEAIPCGAKAATDSLSYLNPGISLVFHHSSGDVTEPLKREHRSSSHGSCGWIALFLFTGLRTFMHFLLVKQYVVAEFRYHPISFFVGYQFLPVVNPPCFPSSRRVEVPRPVQLGSLKSENEGQDWKILWRGDWQWLHEILGALFCMFSSRSKHIKTMGDCGCFKHTEKNYSWGEIWEDVLVQIMVRKKKKKTL